MPRSRRRPSSRASVDARARPEWGEHSSGPPRSRPSATWRRASRQDRPRALIQMATGSRQDLHRHQLHLPADQVRRRPARAVPGGPRQPRRAGREGVPAVTSRPTTTASSPSCTTSSTCTSNTHRPSRPRRASRTIQRLYSMLKGEPELDPKTWRKRSLFERRRPLLQGAAAGRLQPRASRSRSSTSSSSTSATARSTTSGGRCWSTSTPTSIGLTATPAKQTFGFFNQNLVMEYGHEQAVADGVNVDYDVYRIRTADHARAARTVEAGALSSATATARHAQDALGGARRGPRPTTPTQLDRDVVATDQIRTVIRTFRDKLFTEIFPGRTRGARRR